MESCNEGTEGKKLWREVRTEGKNLWREARKLGRCAAGDLSEGGRRVMADRWQVCCQPHTSL